MTITSPLLLVATSLLYQAHCNSAFKIDTPLRPVKSIKQLRVPVPAAHNKYSILRRASRDTRIFLTEQGTTLEPEAASTETFLQAVADSEYDRALSILGHNIAEEIDSFDQLSPDVIAMIQESPFTWRMQTQPRGYPGDFETIEKIFQGNQAPPGTFANRLEEFLLVDNLSQQHRNKVTRQAQVIERAAIDKTATHGPEARSRILSIACGGCIDMRSIANPGLVLKNSDLVLFDMDQGALDYSKSKLEPYGLNCSFIKSNVLRLSKIPGLAQQEETKKFDAVVAGGLFDYLPDRVIVNIVKYVYWELLRVGGTFFFTNIGTDLDSTSKKIFNRLLNWVLIERSEDDLRSLIAAAGVPESDVNIEKDETGLTYLVEIVKARGGELV